MSQPPAIRPADIWLGQGFWKFAYVTTDRSRAIEQFKSELGIEEFETFDRSFEIVTGDGQRGNVRTNIAFSVGRHNTVELIEPVDGLIDLWADPLRDAQGFAVAFHHVGLLVDDLQAMRRAAAIKGMHPVVGSVPESNSPWVFYLPPLLGYYVEHMEAAPRAQWLAGLQDRVLPPPE
jgi:hypothetical protein